MTVQRFRAVIGRRLFRTRRLRIAGASVLTLALFGAAALTGLYPGLAHGSTVSGAILNYLKGAIIQGETNCTNDLAYERTTGDAPRAQVNNSHPYKEFDWITPRNQPTSPVTAVAGDTTPIPLQLNDIQFICAIITSPNSNRTTALSSTIVTNSQFPNDRAPNPDNGNVDSTSRYELRTRIKSGSVTSGASTGSLTGVAPNTVLKASFDPTSRYWMSYPSEPFTYVPPPGGLPAGTTTVHIRFVVNEVYTYHAYFGQPGAVTDCSNNSGNDVFFTTSINYNICSDNTVDVAFQIVTHNPDVDPTVSGSSCTVTGTAKDGDSPNTQLKVAIYDGSTLKATTTTTGSSHSFTFSRSLLGNAADWGSHTYRIHAYGVNGSGLPAAPDTDKNVAVGPCGQLSCGAMTPALGAVGQQTDFQVYMNVAQASSNPPGAKNIFAVTVSGPGITKTYSRPGDALSGGKIYSQASSKMSFTPPGGGMYTVSWTYNGVNCSKSMQAAFAPFFNVLGGDIMAGTRFGGSATCPAAAEITGSNLNGSPNYSGAGGELAALATGDITNFVSGMGLSGGAAKQSGYGLSFANDTNVGGANYGGDMALCDVPAVNDYYAGVTGVTSTWSGSGNITSGVTNNFKLTTATTLSLPGMSLTANTVVNLYVKGNVYITGDIKYGSYALGHAPRFNLYASGNIYIDPNVQELHGVYVAQKNGASGGDIDSCANMPFGVLQLALAYGTCNQKQLTVYGSMMAEGTLSLARTLGNVVNVPAYGGQPSVPYAPAETFRFSPELWLSTPAGGTLQTQAYASLPPVL